MKLSSALLATALSAALLVTPVVSISNVDADAAAGSIVDLTAAADQSANNSQHQHEQRELWQPYFKKECCELECKPKCGTDEEENCKGEF